MERSITVSAPQRSAQRSFSTSSSVSSTSGRGAHVGVDLGAARAADAHRVEALGEVDLVGGDHHAAGGDLVAHLLRREVRLALGDAAHLRRDDAEARVLELRHGLEAGGRAPAAVGATRPVRRHEVPGRPLRRRRHARRVGRGEGPAACRLAAGSRSCRASCPVPSSTGCRPWREASSESWRGLLVRAAERRGCGLRREPFPTLVRTRSGSKGLISGPAPLRGIRAVGHPQAPLRRHPITARRREQADSRQRRRRASLRSAPDARAKPDRPARRSARRAARLRPQGRALRPERDSRASPISRRSSPPAPSGPSAPQPGLPAAPDGGRGTAPRRRGGRRADPRPRCASRRSSTGRVLPTARCCS